MYYSHTCPACGKVFYTFSDDKELAAQTLYAGIKEHEKEYSEAEKDTSLYHGETQDTNQIYSEITEGNEAPSGGYQL